MIRVCAVTSTLFVKRATWWMLLASRPCPQMRPSLLLGFPLAAATHLYEQSLLGRAFPGFPSTALEGTTHAQYKLGKMHKNAGNTAAACILAATLAAAATVSVPVALADLCLGFRRKLHATLCDTAVHPRSQPIVIPLLASALGWLVWLHPWIFELLLLLANLVSWRRARGVPCRLVMC